jgi:hypothetical protein
MKTVISVKAGIQIQKNRLRIKSGMTQCVKSFLRHYAESVLLIVRRS